MTTEGIGVPSGVEEGGSGRSRGADDTKGQGADNGMTMASEGMDQG